VLKQGVGRAVRPKLVGRGEMLANLEPIATRGFLASLFRPPPGQERALPAWGSPHDRCDRGGNVVNTTVVPRHLVR
jgi:hypothetical protein